MLFITLITIVCDIILYYIHFICVPLITKFMRYLWSAELRLFRVNCACASMSR